MGDQHASSSEVGKAIGLAPKSSLIWKNTQDQVPVVPGVLNIHQEIVLFGSLDQFRVYDYRDSILKAMVGGQMARFIGRKIFPILFPLTFICWCFSTTVVGIRMVDRSILHEVPFAPFAIGSGFSQLFVFLFSQREFMGGAMKTFETSFLIFNVIICSFSLGDILGWEDRGAFTTVLILASYLNWFCGDALALNFKLIQKFMKKVHIQGVSMEGERNVPRIPEEESYKFLTSMIKVLSNGAKNNSILQSARIKFLQAKCFTADGFWVGTALGICVQLVFFVVFQSENVDSENPSRAIHLGYITWTTEALFRLSNINLSVFMTKRAVVIFRCPIKTTSLSLKLHRIPCAPSWNLYFEFLKKIETSMVKGLPMTISIEEKMNTQESIKENDRSLCTVLEEGISQEKKENGVCEEQMESHASLNYLGQDPPNISSVSDGTHAQYICQEMRLPGSSDEQVRQESSCHEKIDQASLEDFPQFSFGIRNGRKVFNMNSVVEDDLVLYESGGDIGVGNGNTERLHQKKKDSRPRNSYNHRLGEKIFQPRESASDVPSPSRSTAPQKRRSLKVFVVSKYMYHKIMVNSWNSFLQTIGLGSQTHKSFLMAFCDRTTFIMWIGSFIAHPCCLLFPDRWYSWVFLLVTGFGIVYSWIGISRCNRDLRIRCCKGFEAGYLIANSFAYSFCMGDYVGWKGVGWILVMFHAWGTVLYGIMMDATPIDFEEFDNRLARLISMQHLRSEKRVNPILVEVCEILGLYGSSILEQGGSGFCVDREEFLKMRKNLNLRASFLERNIYRLEALYLCGRRKLISVIFGVVSLTIQYIALDMGQIPGGESRELNMYIGTWTTQRIAYTCIFNMSLFFLRKGASLYLNSFRSLSVEQEIYKIPDVDGVWAMVEFQENEEGQRSSQKDHESVVGIQDPKPGLES